MNLLEENYQLALPIAKKDVIIKCESKVNSQRIRYMYFTPEGYRFRIKFNKWLNKNSMSTQEWYDKYYLNIALPSQRPSCIYPGCNEICEFSKCSIGYTDFCCHSHCQSYNWIKNNGESKEKASKSHIEYFKDENNRVQRGIDTKNGFIRKGKYDIDENGDNGFTKEKRLFYATDKGKEVSRRRSIKLKKENNPEFSEKMKIIVNSPEYIEKQRNLLRIAMSNPDLRSYLSKIRINKFLTDDKFRENQLSVLSKNRSNRSWSGYVYSSKCTNGDENGYVQFDSTYELAFIVRLENDINVIKYEREPNLDIFYNINGFIKTYIPDFLIYYSDNYSSRILAEIKPLSRIDDEINILKKESAEEYCKNISDLNYVIFTEVDIFNEEFSYNSFKEYNIYLGKLRSGYKSTNEKIIEMLNNI